jgi:hypothetical protein
MPAGRPKKGDAGTLYAFAHQFYFDFRSLLEGSYRQRINREKYERLLARAVKVQLRDDQMTHVRKFVDEEITDGRLEEIHREKRLLEVAESTLRATHEELRFRAAKLATVQLKLPGEPGVIEALLQARTAEKIRAICRDAVAIRTVEVAPGQIKEVEVPNWPIVIGSLFPTYLAQHASTFIAAKKHPRFPRSDRPTSPLKQLWFLSRALAAAMYGFEVRTAINLVGSKRPEQVFEESRAATPSRRKKPQRKKS